MVGSIIAASSSDTVDNWASHSVSKRLNEVLYSTILFSRSSTCAAVRFSISDLSYFARAVNMAFFFRVMILRSEAKTLTGLFPVAAVAVVAVVVSNVDSDMVVDVSPCFLGGIFVLLIDHKTVKNVQGSFLLYLRPRAEVPRNFAMCRRVPVVPLNV